MIAKKKNKSLLTGMSTKKRIKQSEKKTLLKNDRTTKHFFNKSTFINTLTKKGKKYCGEKLLLNSIKKYQKVSKKKFLDIFKVSLRNSVVLFKIVEPKARKKASNPTKLFYFLSRKKNQQVEAMKNIVLIMKTLYSKDSMNLKSTEKLLSVLNDSVNFSEKFSFVLDIQKEITFQKKYISRFKWK